MMKLICPSCGATHSAEAWSSDADARQCIKIVGELPWDISRRVLAYLALFRPHDKSPLNPPFDKGGKGGLRWSKALKLLHELQELVKETHIQWKGQPARACNSIAWGLALEKVIENPPGRLPLKSHGYLRAVAWEVADELDKSVERKKIAIERSGGLRSGDQAVGSKEYAVGSDEDRITPEKMREIREKNFKR